MCTVHMTVLSDGISALQQYKSSSFVPLVWSVLIPCSMHDCIYFARSVSFSCTVNTHSDTHSPFMPPLPPAPRPYSPASLSPFCHPPSLLTRRPPARCLAVSVSDAGDIIRHNESTATSSSTVHCPPDSERPCPGGGQRWRGTLPL